MGAFSVRARVWNPRHGGPAAEAELLVDTGATYTVLPATLLAELEVRPARQVKVRLADGRVLERPVGEVGMPVIFGEEGIYLLGAVTMEQLGLAPDPAARRLRPVEALPMAALGRPEGA